MNVILGSDESKMLGWERESEKNFNQEIHGKKRKKTRKFLALGVTIGVIAINMLGSFWLIRERQLYLAAQTIQNCIPQQKDCQGRIEALSKLVLAQRSLQSYNLENANLENVNLGSANLMSARLYGANLVNANLKIADLESVRLHGANIMGANLESANLENGYLHSVNLEDVNLENVNLKNVNLIRANLMGAKLIGANMMGANLIGAKNLLPSQIKLACNWERAIYKGNWSSPQWQWRMDELANQEYINKLKLDQDSDPHQPVDCSRWN